MTQQGQIQPPFAGETFEVHRSPYMVTLRFRAPSMPQASVGIAIPPTVAKQLAMVLRTNVLKHEQEYGELRLPPDSYKQMGVSPEDWDAPGSLTGM